MSFWQSRYPRLYCLGLIEAGAHVRVAEEARQGIRGFIASASLKLNCGSPSMRTSVWYPRLYCLGLIEACRGSRRRQFDRDCIRGFIASASLKQRLRRLEGRKG